MYSDDENTPFPSPTSTPAFCKRMTNEDMRKKSQDLTKKELDKLAQKIPNETKMSDVISAKELNSDIVFSQLHYMLSSYADKCQQYTTDICHLNDVLSDKKEQIMKLRDDINIITDDKNHFEQLCDDYEEDLQNTAKQATMYKKSRDKYKFATHWMIFMFIVCYFILYVVIMESISQSSDIILTYNAQKYYVKNYVNTFIQDYLFQQNLSKEDSLILHKS